MRTRVRFSASSLGMVAFGCGLLAAQGQALAQSERRAGPGRLCAGHAQGASVDRSLAGCVTVEQRLRVEPHARRGLFSWQTQEDEAVIAAPGAPSASRAHLRLNGDYGQPQDH